MKSLGNVQKRSPMRLLFVDFINEFNKIIFRSGDIPLVGN